MRVEATEKINNLRKSAFPAKLLGYWQLLLLQLLQYMVIKMGRATPQVLLLAELRILLENNSSGLLLYEDLSHFRVYKRAFFINKLILESLNLLNEVKNY